MQPSVHEYLQHILDEASYLTFAVQDTSQQKFLQVETLKRAFVRSIEIIGESVKQIPEALRNQYAQVDWRAIAGMRDRLIHSYYGVDYEIVWDVAANKIPLVAGVIHDVLENDKM